jgi:hypothetical protein
MGLPRLIRFLRSHGDGHAKDGWTSEEQTGSPPVKFRYLEYFVAAAEELNFTHASTETRCLFVINNGRVGARV